jgi:quinol monooxygenase YgiN
VLIVAGNLTVDPADIDRLQGAAAEMMAATRQEDGCIEYVFSVSMADPGTVQIFEIWESAEALEAHFTQPHMATFQAALADLTVTGSSLHRYEIASSAPL